MGWASWIPVMAWFNLHVAELTTVDGPSMYPFMNEDRDTTLRRDVVVNWKWSPQQNLQRGMVVTLRCARAALPPPLPVRSAEKWRSRSLTCRHRSPMHPEVVAVKRVVALEGDVVTTKPPYPFATVRVPTGHVWVEGDGPSGSSLDSNTYGPVSKRLLTGRVTHVLYPLRKFGAVRWWDQPGRWRERVKQDGGTTLA